MTCCTSSTWNRTPRIWHLPEFLVWLVPRAAVTRAVAPAGRGLQPSRANRALASLVLGLLGAQLALSQAGFGRSAFFVMGALYPLIGMVLYRIRYRC